MYKSSIETKINDFLNTERERTGKIDSKVVIINSKIKELKDRINSLEDDCVKCDLDENIDGKEKAEKDITSLRNQLENLEGQRAAYERAKVNYKGSEKAVSKIVKETASEIKKVQKLFQDTINEKQELEKNILQIQKKIRELESEIEYLRIQPESIASQLVRIGDYVYGKGVLEERVKATNNNWYTKEKLILKDLQNV